MHATYFFLVALDLSEEEGSVMEQAEGQFQSYASNNRDDNNWWDLEGVVVNDNRIFGSVIRNRLGINWKHAWDLAARAVACEFRPDVDPEFSLYDRPHREIIQWLNVKLPAYLSRRYQDAAGNYPQSGCDMDRFLRAQMSRAYELYQRVHECDRAPFTSHVTEPYDYRAFDLTGGKEGNAIIFMDIHT